MADKVGFEVAQRVEYGKWLETREDVYFAQKDSWPICDKSVKHFIPEFDQWLPSWDFTADDAEAVIEGKCKELALKAQTWAQNNRPWKDISTQARRLLRGFLVVDGTYK
ncbi:MAG: hypothetical protein LBL45_10230 [Treponema sp.]|jgi:hypothetical protein|nr:hypothetical protein [Treponema sp.]